MPFGYAFAVLAVFVALTTGLCLFGTGWRRRSRELKWTGVVLVTGVIVLVGRQMVFEKWLEWNPMVSDSEIIGQWAEGKETLSLAEDHTFNYWTPNRAIKGQWSRDDWNLHMEGEGGRFTMRIVRFRDKCRIMTHPPDEPDSWNGDLGLEKAGQ